MDGDVAHAGFVQCGRHGVMRQLRTVTLAAEMAEEDVPQPVVRNLHGGFGGGFVGEMAEARKDALLQRPRAIGVLQHARVVVGFQHEDGWRV